MSLFFKSIRKSKQNVFLFRMDSKLQDAIQKLEKRVETLETCAKQAMCFAITQNIEDPKCFPQLEVFARQLDVETIAMLDINHRMWKCITHTDPSLMRILLQGRPIQNLYGPKDGAIFHALVDAIAFSTAGTEMLFMARFKELAAGLVSYADILDFIIETIDDRKKSSVPGLGPDRPECVKQQVAALEHLYAYLKK